MAVSCPVAPIVNCETLPSSFVTYALAPDGLTVMLVGFNPASTAAGNIGLSRPSAAIVNWDTEPSSFAT